MPIDFTQLNQGVACHYAFDEGSGSTASCAFGYGPDLEVGDPTDAWGTSGWVKGSGANTGQHVGWVSSGSAADEELTRNLFQLRNGLMLVCFQVYGPTAPGSNTRMFSLGGQSGSGTSTLRSIDFLHQTSGNIRVNVIKDGGASSAHDISDPSDAADDIITVGVIIDAREIGRHAYIAHWMENGQTISGSVSNNNRFTSADDGLLNGYPTSLTADTGLMIGARWRASNQDWFTAQAFQIRRLTIMNFKRLDPGSLGDCMYELLQNDGVPGQAVYNTLARGVR